MEFCERKGMEDDLEIRKRAKPPKYYSQVEVLSTMYQCIEFFAEAASLRIYHRDIKPDNVFIMGDG
jgi:serine/threonine protein kinase